MHFRAQIKANPRVADVGTLLNLDDRDMATMTTMVDQRFRDHERALFASEGSSSGQRWAELSPAYKAWKARKYPGRKILARKGDLRASLTERNNPQHIARFVRTPKAAIEVGTSDPKAVHHARGSGRMPKRDPMAHSQPQVRAYYDEIKTVMVAKLERLARVLAAWKGR